jgi:hypothetical protein
MLMGGTAIERRLQGTVCCDAENWSESTPVQRQNGSKHLDDFFMRRVIAVPKDGLLWSRHSEPPGKGLRLPLMSRPVQPSAARVTTGYCVARLLVT